MTPISLQDIAAVTHGELHLANQDANSQIYSVSTDSRKIGENGLFIALKGERFDAHDFVATAIESGAKALIVTRKLAVDCPQVIVADTRIALGELAAWNRQQSKAKIVALTGSSGKTSVKEMTATILAACGSTLYTAGNLNNDIGVPLTLLRLTEQHQFAVVELGANHKGEIAYTTAMTQPQTALVNNLYSAHLEGFGSLQGVADAKGEIFQGLANEGTAIINLDSNDWQNWQHLLNPRQTIWRFAISNQPEADFYPTAIQTHPLTTDFLMHTPAGDIEITLPLPGKHNISNALASAALALSVGATLEDIKRGLSLLHAVPGRLYPIKLAEGKHLFDDTYNANTGSMIAAINVLSQMPGYRVLVVGDMGELGKDAEQCHRQVGQAAQQNGIDAVFSVGNLSQFISEESSCGQHFAFKADLVTALVPLLKQHSIISVLIKGSRSSAMEDIVNALKEKVEC